MGASTGRLFIFMPTRSQINTYIQNNQTRIRNYIESLVDGEGGFTQIKRLDNRDDAQVHVYEGPFGKGYSIVLTAIEGEDVYNRSFHFGPESRPSDTGWVLYKEDWI